MATGTSLTTTAESTFIGQVASFTDADSNPGDYTAEIHWGDGTVSSGTIAETSTGNFTIAGSHVFGESGPHSIGVRMRDTKGDEAIAYTLALVIPSLQQSNIAVSEPVIVAGCTTSVTLTARDANGMQETSGGQAVTFSLAGGSGSGTFGTVTDNGDGTYTATFTGNTVGADTITATIDDLAVTLTATLTVTPASVDLQWAGAGNVLSLTENISGATPAMIISEPSPNVSLLKIDLGAGYAFAAPPRSSATGLTYQNPGSPTTSQFATIDISLTNNVSTLVATLPGDRSRSARFEICWAAWAASSPAPPRSKWPVSTRTTPMATST